MKREYFLTTERLGFSWWTEGDLELAKSLWEDPKVCRYICAAGQFSDEEVRERLALEVENGRRHHVQYWPVFDLEAGGLAGCCGLRPHGGRMYEMGVHLKPEFWGRGIAGEACRAVMWYACSELNAEGLFAGRHPENNGSRRLLERLGFKYTGEEFYSPTGLYHPSYEKRWSRSCFKTALLQILPGNSLEENLEKGIAWCREAKKAGADLALFPEMWSCGYDIPESVEELERKAVAADGPFVKAFASAARELSMAIGITILERHPKGPRNTLLLLDRHGECVLSYAKVHTCDFGDEGRLTPGEEFCTADLDTEAGAVRVGAMICYDREFPESARILMLKGAEIVLVPNACPMEINRLSQLRGRAYENMMGIATCNYPQGKPDCNGHSSAFDGVAYLPEEEASRDMCILEADGAEGVWMAEFDLELLRAYRRQEVHGNAYRHPERYGLLTEDAVRPPFVRKDRRRPVL